MTWCPVWMMPYLTTIDTTIDYSTRQAIFLMDQVTWWMMDELSFISPDMQYSSDDTQYLSSSPYFSCSTRQHHQSPVKSAATRRLDVTRTIYQQTSSEPLVPAKLTLYHDGFTMSGSVWSLLWMKSTGLLSQVLQHGRYCIQVRRRMGFWWFNMALRATFFFKEMRMAMIWIDKNKKPGSATSQDTWIMK